MAQLRDNSAPKLVIETSSQRWRSLVQVEIESPRFIRLFKDTLGWSLKGQCSTLLGDVAAMLRRILPDNDCSSRRAITFSAGVDASQTFRQILLGEVLDNEMATIRASP
jgi:hypothetical protein